MTRHKMIYLMMELGRTAIAVGAVPNPSLPSSYGAMQGMGAGNSPVIDAQNPG